MRQYQIVNRRVILEQILNQQKVTHPKSKELLYGIMIYIAEQRVLQHKHKHVKYYNSHAAVNNIVDLSQDERIYNNLYEGVNNKYKKNEAFKKAIDDLIYLEAIYPIDTEGNYVLNPLFYYDGIGFLNVYLHWCFHSKSKTENKYVEDCLNDGGQYSTPDVDELNSMVNKGVYQY